MDSLLPPVTHRPSLSYPLNPMTPDDEQAEQANAPYNGHPRYSRQSPIWGNASYNAFARRKPGPWMTKLFRLRKRDVTTLCTGSCLPCVLYGKTQYRLKQIADGEDPLDVSRHDICNGPCWMFGMIMCCVGFDLMLQHSRVRATYNIDGTAGGDCVQSLFCTRCTLMQDEWEVLAREEKFVSERTEAEVNRQPAPQQQMRYSTSNLLEEVPDVFRPMALNAQKVEVQPRVSSPLPPGADETLANDSLLQGISYQDNRLVPIDHAAPNNRPRQSSYVPQKMGAWKSSPIGSALNPITRRSNSVGLGERSVESNLPQRSVTNPSRSTAPITPLAQYQAPNYSSYRSRGKITVEPNETIPQKLTNFNTIQEETRSEDFNPSVRSDVGVKSLALGSIYSGSSLHKTRNDAKANESVIVYYGHEDTPQFHRLSDCSRSRPLTPEPYDSPAQDKILANKPEILKTKDNIQSHAHHNIDRDTGQDGKMDDARERGVDHMGMSGDKMHDEEMFAQLSTPTLMLQRFSIVPTELGDQCIYVEPVANVKSGTQAPSIALEAAHQDGDDFTYPASIERTETPIKYMVDIDSFFDIPTKRIFKNSSNDSFKSIVNVSATEDKNSREICKSDEKHSTTKLFGCDINQPSFTVWTQKPHGHSAQSSGNFKSLDDNAVDEPIDTRACFANQEREPVDQARQSKGSKFDGEDGDDLDNSPTCSRQNRSGVIYAAEGQPDIWAHADGPEKSPKNDQLGNPGGKYFISAKKKVVEAGYGKLLTTPRRPRQLSQVVLHHHIPGSYPEMGNLPSGNSANNDRHGRTEGSSRVEDSGSGVIRVLHKHEEVSDMTRLKQNGDTSAIEISNVCSEAFGSIADDKADDKAEVKCPGPIPVGLRTTHLGLPEEPARENNLLSDDCDFISAEQHMLDTYNVGEEKVNERISVLSLKVNATQHAGRNPLNRKVTLNQLSESTSAANITEQTLTLATSPERQEGTPKSVSSNVVKKETCEASVECTDSALLKRKDRNQRGMRQGSKRARSRKGRKKRAVEERLKARS